MKIYKYFLLHNKKLKTWIKYWLYHKKADGSGILSEILQGFSFNLENTLNRKFKLFEIEGNSDQESTKGYQLFDGIMEQGDIPSYNGQNQNNTQCIRSKNYIPLEPSTAYFFEREGVITDSVGIRFYDIDKNYLSNETTTMGYSVKTKAFTTANNVYYMRFTDWTNNLSNTYMLSKGTTSVPYEKYTGGIASPNPNYEQPIYSAGDNENLFDGETITFNAYDNIETAKDGLVTTKELSNTGTSNVNIRFPALNLSPDTYYISMDIRIKSGTGDFVKLNDGATDWSVVSKSTISSSFQRYVYKHTYTAEKALNQILVQFSNNSNTIYEIEKIMVSNKATPYSPYGMGSINQKIQTRNLVDGVLDNSLSATAKLITKDMNVLVPAGTYTISFTNKPVQSNGNIYSGSTNILNIPWYSDKKTFTLTETTLITRITCDVGANQIVYAQLEPGTTATPYVPHEEQDYSIFVQQPMRSIGDVRDKFVKKKDGNWYERHYITELGLDGTENWSRSDTQGFIRFVVTLANMKSVGSARSTNILCNKFKGSIENEYGNCFAFNNTVAFYVPENIEDFSTWKNWIEENNVKLQYELETPLDLPCTETQIQQLENKPSTYKDFTIIQSEDTTPAYLKIQYYKEV